MAEHSEASKLEEAAKPQHFNPNIHEADEHGDPVRTADGSIRLKRDWKERAVDRQGRKYNAHVHGEKMELDDEGYIRVRRRRSSQPIGAVNRSEAFVNKYREPGYEYYLMNADGGRMEQFTANDWEPVVTEAGQARMKVGQARSPDTEAVLMKKPKEWHEDDQRKKREQRVLDMKSKTAPKAEHGQYEAQGRPNDPNSALR